MMVSRMGVHCALGVEMERGWSCFNVWWLLWVASESKRCWEALLEGRCQAVSGVERRERAMRTGLASWEVAFRWRFSALVRRCLALLGGGLVGPAGLGCRSQAVMMACWQRAVSSV